MTHDYSDITDRIAEDPEWYDENAVPRYGSFKPDAIANFYANECVLMEISCQNCGELFKVAMSLRRADTTIADEIKVRTLHYGDPPNNGCCAGGASMNCNDLRILEYWRRINFEWVRDKDLEIELT